MHLIDPATSASEEIRDKFVGKNQIATVSETNISLSNEYSVPLLAWPTEAEQSDDYVPGLHLLLRWLEQEKRVEIPKQSTTLPENVRGIAKSSKHGEPSRSSR